MNQTINTTAAQTALTENQGLILDVANDLTDLRIAISMALASKTFQLYEQNFRKSKKARAITKSLRKTINKGARYAAAKEGLNVATQ